MRAAHVTDRLAAQGMAPNKRAWLVFSPGGVSRRISSEMDINIGSRRNFMFLSRILPICHRTGHSAMFNEDRG